MSSAEGERLMRSSLLAPARTLVAGIAIVLASAGSACAPEPAPQAAPAVSVPQEVAAALPAPADTLRIPPLNIPYIPLPRTDEPAERGLDFRLVEGGGPRAPDAATRPVVTAL